MLTDETLKAVIEAIIYVAPDPVSLDAIAKALEGEERDRVKAKLEELMADFLKNEHGIQIRQVAGGYTFSSKPEHHEVLRTYVKSLKPPIRLSKPALETLAVIAYKQPATLPEIDAIRGVDSGGVIHTLMEKKLIVTAGRKSVVGRPILYRTSREFLVHFGLKDVGELPSLKEFEELAKRALGSELAAEPGGTPAEAISAEAVPGESLPAEVPPTNADTSAAAPAEPPPADTPPSQVAPEAASTEAVSADADPSEPAPATPEAAPTEDVPPSTESESS